MVTTRRIIRPPAPLRPGQGRKTPAQQQAESDIYRRLRDTNGQSSAVVIGTGNSAAEQVTPVDLAALQRQVTAQGVLIASLQTSLASLQSLVALLGTINHIQVTYSTQGNPINWKNTLNVVEVDTTGVPDGGYIGITLPSLTAYPTARVLFDVLGDASLYQIVGYSD